MARIITTQHAKKIVKKLKGKKREGSAHTHYDFYFEEVLIATTTIRRGSEKDQGHDHMQCDLHVNGFQAKQLAACPLTLDEWIEILRGKGFIEF